jgi:hypothetical protein
LHDVYEACTCHILFPRSLAFFPPHRLELCFSPWRPCVWPMLTVQCFFKRTDSSFLSYHLGSISARVFLCPHFCVSLPLTQVQGGQLMGSLEPPCRHTPGPAGLGWSIGCCVCDQLLRHSTEPGVLTTGWDQVSQWGVSSLGPPSSPQPWCPL